MNSKYGGIGLKSGIHTAGAQHLQSLVNSAKGIRRFIPNWDLNQKAKEESEVWLSEKLGKKVDTSLIISSLVHGRKFGVSESLSLAQWCESAEKDRVLTSMSSEERLFIESNSGPGCSWVKQYRCHGRIGK